MSDIISNMNLGSDVDIASIRTLEGRVDLHTKLFINVLHLVTKNLHVSHELQHGFVCRVVIEGSVRMKQCRLLHHKLCGAGLEGFCDEADLLCHLWVFAVS